MKTPDVQFKRTPSVAINSVSAADRIVSIPGKYILHIRDGMEAMPIWRNMGMFAARLLLALLVLFPGGTDAYAEQAAKTTELRKLPEPKIPDLSYTT
ncbi:MAG: hypothetical protein ACREUR_06800, partial [Nitrosospira sp.]